jgi:hypothetical protein
VIVRKSDRLAEQEPGVAPPPFERFRNRLKVMSDLDPVIYPTPRRSVFRIVIDRRRVPHEKGEWDQCTYALHLTFDDAAADPSVELRAELERREPVVDPAIVLE